jgi:hypothetical protein
MTLASRRPAPSRWGAVPPDGRPVSDFHLVEGADGWRLTVNVTDRLRDLLDGNTAGDSAAPSFTVHVEPNLLPGAPFPVSIEPIANED